MSLYEQFHSDINKQHMFKLIETYLQKEKNIDISNNKKLMKSFYQVYRLFLRKIMQMNLKK